MSGRARRRTPGRSRQARTIGSAQSRRAEPPIYEPDRGFASPDAAYLTSALDELSERLFDLVGDLVGDLSAEALGFMPEGGTNSIAMLVRHMANAEAVWIAAVTGESVPGPLASELKEGAQDGTGELPRPSCPPEAAALVDLARRVRRDLTKGRVSKMRDIDVEVSAGARVLTPRGVLMNQLWHWTYHTGQVGLLRRLGGARYAWRYDDRIAPGR